MSTKGSFPIGIPQETQIGISPRCDGYRLVLRELDKAIAVVTRMVEAGSWGVLRNMAYIYVQLCPAAST
jgi:hypothetical protein